MKPNLSAERRSRAGLGSERTILATHLAKEFLDFRDILSNSQKIKDSLDTPRQKIWKSVNILVQFPYLDLT